MAEAARIGCVYVLVRDLVLSFAVAFARLILALSPPMSASDQFSVPSLGNPSGQRLPLASLLMPWRIVQHLRRHGNLILQFTKRDVLGRYRGSYLGVFWSLLRPLFMLTVFGVVFGYIFQSRLGNDPHESKVDFAMALFCGLIVFEFVSESLARAPTIILSNPNYVTKVVFPLEILPVSVVGAALVHLLISLIPLCFAYLVVHHSMHWTALSIPLILIPLLFLALGIAWLLSSLGVFIRDINSFVPVLNMVVMYGSAIFYRISIVPPALRPIVTYNPLAVMVDDLRNVFMWGLPMDWRQYGLMTLVCFLFMLVAYAFFMRTKSAFADVV
jgi:lipopolysaccharide transport system permease protein